MARLNTDIMQAADQELDFGIDFDIFLSGVPDQKPEFSEAVNIDTITKSSPIQTREKFDPEKNDEDAEFLDSIKAEGGNHDPIWLVALEGEHEKYQVIAGHRRIQALQAAGIPTARAIVWPASTPPEVLDKLTILENYHRKELAPLETAQALSTLMETHKMTLTKAAKFVGISKAHASRLMQVSAGAPEITALLAEGVVGVRSAKTLNDLPAKAQAAAVAAIRAGKPIEETLEAVKTQDLIEIENANPGVRKTDAPQTKPALPLLESIKTDETLHLLTGGRTQSLVKTVSDTPAFQRYSINEIQLIALYRLGLNNKPWKEVFLKFPSLMRADLRALRTAFSAGQQILHLKAYQNKQRIMVMLDILIAYIGLIKNEIDH